MDKMKFSPDWHNSQRFWKTVLGLFLCLGLLTSSSTADDRFRSGSTAGLILRGKNIPKSSPNVCRYGTSQYCCPGWLQLYPNGPCTQPICKGFCGEGRCIAPNSCHCPDGRIRHTCLRDTLSSTHQRYVNVADTKTACEDLRCHQHCSVYLDKAFCSCMRGYHLGIDGRHCQDINECHSHNVPCHQRCVNTPGSFRCSCFESYVLTSNGRTCRRIDDHSIDGACKDGACEERTSEIQSDTPDRLLSSTWTNSRPNTLVNQRHVIDGGQGQPLFTDDEFQKAFGDYFRGSNTESANQPSRFGRSAARQDPSRSVVGRLQRPLQSEVQPNYDRRVPVVEFRRGSSVIQASLHTGRQLGQTSTNQNTYGQTFSGTQGHQAQYPPRNRQGYPSRVSQSNQGYHTYSTQDSRPTHQSSFNARGSRTYGQRSQGSSSYGQTSSSRHSSRLDPGQHVSFTNGRASVSVGLHHTFDPENQDQGQRSTSYQDRGQSSTQYQGRRSSGYDGTSGRVASTTSGGRLTNSGRDQRRSSVSSGFDTSWTRPFHEGSAYGGTGARSSFGLGSVSQGSMGGAFRGPEPNYRGSATSGFEGPESPRSMNNMGFFPSRDRRRGSQGQYFLNDGRTLVNQRTGDDSSKTPAQNPFPDLSDGNRKVFIDTSRQFSSPQFGSSQYQAGTGLRGGGGSRSSFQSGASQIPGGTQYLGSNSQSQSQFPGGAAQQFQPNSNGQVPFASEGNTFVDTSKQFSSVGQPGIPPDGFPFQSNQQGRLGKKYIQLPDGSFVEDTSGRAIQGQVQVQVQGQSQGCLDPGNLNSGQTQNGGCGGATQGGNSGPGGAVVDLSTDGRPYTDPNAQIFQPEVDKIPTCGNSGQAGNGQTGGCANPTGLANQGANWNPTYDQLTNWNDFNQYIGQVGRGFNQQRSQRVGCGTAGGQPNWNVNVGRWEEPIGPLPYGPVNCNGGGNGGRLPCGNNGEVSCTGPGYETDLPTRGSTGNTGVGGGGNTGAGGQLPCSARGETSCTGPNGQPINGQNGQLPCGSNGEISCTGPQLGSQLSSNQFGGSQTGGFPVDQSGNYLGIGRSTVIENSNGFPIDRGSLQTGGNTDGFPIDSENGNGNGFPIDSGNGNGFPIDAGKGNGNGFPISSGTGTGGDSRLGTIPIDIEMIGKSTDGSTDSRTPGEVAIPTETADRVPESLTFPIDGSSVEGSDVIGENWPSGIPHSSGGTRAKPMVIDRVVEFRAQVPHFGGEEGPQRGDIQVGTDSSDSRNVRITANGASILCTGPACRGQLEGQGDGALSFQCSRGKVPRLTKHGIACMLLEDLDEPACKPQCANGGTCEGGKCVCPPGITGPTCNYDIDECTILSTTAQRCPFKCENTFGSYRCVCPPGQTLNSDGRSCKTVECFPRCLNKGKCVEGKCECPREFKGKYCQSDVNECKDNPSLCQFYCRNTFGGYACLCPPDSRLEPDKRSCTQETCPHECQKGGVCVKGRCRCPPGYYGLTCQLDINECTHFKPCSHECVNSIGSFSCNCPEGLVLKYDARTCQNATLAAAELDMK